MRAWRRRIAGLAVGLIVLGLIVWMVSPSPVRVDLARVERGQLVVTVDEEGRTRVHDRFVITAPISGRVARITLDPGDAVEPGTVIARLHPLPLDPRTRVGAEARLAAAEAEQSAALARVEEAKAASDQARRSAQRSRQLRSKGTISAEELEQVELEETTHAKELDAAQFAARSAAFDVEAARAALMAPGQQTAQELVAACESGEPDCIELHAPIRGSVLRVIEQSERIVAEGTPLLELGDPSALEIVVDVLSSDAVKVPAGAVMIVEDWGGNHPLRARVRVVEPSGFTKLSALGVEEQRVNIIADFEEPAVGLGDNYRVDVRIVVWEGSDIVKAPISALFRSAGQWCVFVVDAGRARRRVVEIGQRNATEVQILRGVEERTQVVLHPSDRIDDGVRVEPL